MAHFASSQKRAVPLLQVTKPCPCISGPGNFHGVGGGKQCGGWRQTCSGSHIPDSFFSGWRLLPSVWIQDSSVSLLISVSSSPSLSVSFSLCLLAANALALTPSVSPSVSFPLFLGLCLSLLPFLQSLSLSASVPSFCASVYFLAYILSHNLCCSICLSVCLFPCFCPHLSPLSALFLSLCVSLHLCHSHSPLTPLSPQTSPLLPSESLWPPWKGYCKRE